jgi:hypothetical protein
MDAAHFMVAQSDWEPMMTPIFGFPDAPPIASSSALPSENGAYSSLRRCGKKA